MGLGWFNWVQNGPNGYKLIKMGPNRTKQDKMSKTGPNRSKQAHEGPKLAQTDVQMVKKCQKLPKIAPNSLKLS